MEEVMEINGVTITREQMEEWLLSKKITLWAEWIVTKPSQRGEAVDWVLTQMNALAEFAKPADEPKTKSRKKNKVLAPA